MRLQWLPADAPPSAFPPTHDALHEPNGLLCAGGDLSPARLLAAYARGIFPWYGPGEPILWWSPEPRCVLPLAQLHIPERLQRLWRRSDWTLGADQHFAAVMDACAAPRAGQRGTWITPPMRAAYIALHALGHAHSVELHTADGQLIGGLYGIALGRVFFGESMFSRVSNASKTVLYLLAAVLRARGYTLLDGQVESDHLRSLGFELWSRERFEALLANATAQPAAAQSWAARWPLAAVRDYARWATLQPNPV